MAGMSWHDITRLDKEGRLPRPTEGLVDEGDAPQLVEVAMCTSDQHGRFVDWDAWRAVLAILDASSEQRLGFEVGRFIFNGDLVDFYELSRWPKDPSVERPVEDDLAAARTMLGDVRARLGEGKPVDVNPGNHEFRYELHLRTDAKKLSGLKVLELPKLLELDRFGATLHTKAGFMFGDTRVYHGETVRAHAAESAKHEMQKWGTSGTSGHVHRLGIYKKSTHGGTLQWTESGCLCRLDAEYMTHVPNWQHGCVLLFRYSDGSVHHELVRIIEGRVQGTLGTLVHGPEQSHSSTSALAS